ncbi:hypothetical protein KY289_016515 [Solanum tuberosum]|nr:hypothetical protein KY289_016515 [Solanum tuberosum]
MVDQVDGPIGFLKYNPTNEESFGAFNKEGDKRDHIGERVVDINENAEFEAATTQPTTSQSSTVAELRLLHLLKHQLLQLLMLRLLHLLNNLTKRDSRKVIFDKTAEKVMWELGMIFENVNDFRKCIGLDGCFLKGVTKGQLLVVVAKDVNNKMLPIAWSVLEYENKNTWTWFLKLLIEDLRLGDDRDYTLISDMQKDSVVAGRSNETCTSSVLPKPGVRPRKTPATTAEAPTTTGEALRPRGRPKQMLILMHFLHFLQLGKGQKPTNNDFDVEAPVRGI